MPNYPTSVPEIEVSSNVLGSFFDRRSSQAKKSFLIENTLLNKFSFRRLLSFVLFILLIQYASGQNVTGFRQLKSLLTMIFYILIINISSILPLTAQTVLKQEAGSLTTANGLVNSPSLQNPSQVVTMYNGATPSTLTITYSISNQQFGPSMPGGAVEGISSNFGLAFGQTNSTGNNTTVTGFARNYTMGTANGVANSMFKACSTCTGGISVADDYAVSIYATVDALITASNNNACDYGINKYPLNARVQYADLTLTFSEAVNNPVLHFVGLGGSTGSACGTTDVIQGYAPEFELLTAGYTLSKIADNSYLQVTSNIIRNSATLKGSHSLVGTGGIPGAPNRYAASGSVLVTGSIPAGGSLTFRVYLQGDGGWTTASPLINPTWSEDPSAANVIGDLFFISASIPLTLTLSGTVYNDVNGLLGIPVNTIDGPVIGEPSLQNIYANLLDATGTTVIATIKVDSLTGTYSLPVSPNTSYQVQISTVQGVVGSVKPATTLPSGWVNTGDIIPSGTATASTPGITAVIPVTSSNVSGANFGIEQQPTAGSGSNTSLNPNGAVQASVPANTFTNTTSSSDPSPGVVTGIRITSFPTGATSIVINGVTYTIADSVALKALIIPTDASGNPTVTITVDPTANGTTSVSIPFVSRDAAGVESTNTGTAVMNYTAITLSGTVMNDVGGLVTNSIVNGSPIGEPSLQNLYANLLNSTGTTVIAMVKVDSLTGTYSFPVDPNTSYYVQLSMMPGTPGSSTPSTLLPNGWVNTGDVVPSGTATALTPGMTATIAVITTSLTGANFGIEQPPVTMNDTGTGTVGSPVTVNPLTNDTDPSGGTIDPTTVSILPPTGVTITGLVIDAHMDTIGFTVTGQGTWAVDPITGAITFTPVAGFTGSPTPITYNVEDNAGVTSNNSTVTITYPGVPDLSPNITINPNIAVDVTNIDVDVRISELLGVATSGLITVEVQSAASWNINLIPGTVQGIWTYVGKIAGRYRWTTSSVISAGGFSSFNFIASFDPKGSEGRYPFQVFIVPNSGGEVRINNNTDSETLDYFAN